MRYEFQASGYAGGWTDIGHDTRQELQAALVPALEAQGFRVVTLTVEADEWDATTRIIYNQFHYRLVAVLESSASSTIAFSTFVQTVTGITGQSVSASNVTAGDPQQADPTNNPFKGINTTLAIAAVVVIGLVVVLWEAK